MGPTASVLQVVIALLGALMIGYALRRGSVTLYMERRPFLSKVRPGVGGAFPLGMAFAAGWTPCIGPVLATILALAGDASTAAQGSLLLLVYSLGLAVPFVLVGIGFDRAMGASRWLRDRYDVVRFISGALLVALGLLLFFDRFWWIRIAFNRLFEKFGVDV